MSGEQASTVTLRTEEDAPGEAASGFELWQVTPGGSAFDFSPVDGSPETDPRWAEEEEQPPGGEAGSPTEDIKAEEQQQAGPES